MAYAHGKRRNIFESNGRTVNKTLDGQKFETKTFVGTGSLQRKFLGISYTDSKRKYEQEGIEQEKRKRTFNSSWWEVEPAVGRVANGVSNRVDRLRGLGNAVVPYQAYQIFEAIAEFERDYKNQRLE